MIDETRILELEHATIRPIGDYPDHCLRCRWVAEMRALQSACPHTDVSEVEITALGDP